MKILIAGEHPFAREIADLSERAGHEALAYLIEDFYDAIESGFVMEALPAVDIAVEIHNESPESKQELLLNMAYGMREKTLLLTSAFTVNTTEAAAWVPYPERVVGFGLLPPLGERSVVELAAGLNTDSAYLEQAENFWESLGLKTRRVPDSAGLVTGRFVAGFINEAVNLLVETGMSPQELDALLGQGAGLEIGPLALADYLGIDAVHGLLAGLFQESADRRYRPAPLLRRMTLAGKIGQKVGGGFFSYRPLPEAASLRRDL